MGKCSPAEDKIKLDPQSPCDAHTPECLENVPTILVQEIALTAKFTPYIDANIGKDNSEVLVIINNDDKEVHKKPFLKRFGSADSEHVTIAKIKIILNEI